MISLILPTFNRASFLFGTLICLLNQKTTHPYEVVVIDSGTDQTEQMIQTQFAEVKHLRYQKIPPLRNRSALRNKGAALAQYDLLAFVDGDILVPPDFVESHLKLHQAQESLVVLGKRRSLTEYDLAKISPIALAQNFTLLERMPFYRDSRDQFLSANGVSIETCGCPWRFVFSHNFSIHRSLFVQVQQFNQDFGENWGFEDIELGFRLHQAGARFLMLENHHTYHQPHLEQSRLDQPLATKNALLFSRLFPFFEIELVSLFGSDLGDLYVEIQSILTQVGPSQQIIEILDPSKEIVLSYLHSADLKNPGPSHHYLGVFLQNLAPDSVHTIRILPSFYQFGELIQAGILAEALRVGRLIRFSDCGEAEEAKIRNRCRLLGWTVKAERQGLRLTIDKRTKNPSRVLILVLPSLFDPRKRFGYLALAHRLEQRGYRVVLQDPKTTVTVADEDFGVALAEVPRFECMIDSQFAYLADRHIIPSEFALMGLFTGLRPGSIVVEDLGYPSLDGYLSVPRLTGTIQLDATFLDKIALIHWLEGCTIEGAATLPPPAATFVAVMAKGFDEDGLSDLLEGFEVLHSQFPEVKLVIKTADDRCLADHCFYEHNVTSRRLKLQGTLRKSERDQLKLSAMVSASRAREAIRIVRENWTVETYGQFIASAHGFLCATRGTVVPLDLSMALVLQVPVLIPGHLICEPCLIDNRDVFRVDTRRVPFSEAFDIPETSATLKLTAEVMEITLLNNQMRNLYVRATDLRATAGQQQTSEAVLSQVKAILDPIWDQIFS